MTDQEIEAAGETFKRLLRENRDCEYGRIEGEIKKNKLDELILYPERPGIRGGRVVLTVKK